MPATRYEALDGLRGVAAFFVIFHHIRWTNHTFGTALVENGYLMVDLFFILSGFVIAASYFERLNDGAAARDFMILRVFRVYPLHLFLLLGLVCLELAKYATPASMTADGPFTANSPQSLAANLLLVHAWDVLPRLTWNLPSWSISAEFGAYIAFAVIMASGLGRRPGFWTVATCVAIAGYVALAFANGSLDLTYQLGLPRCLCGFAIGVFLHRSVKVRVSERAPYADLAIFVAMVVAMALIQGAAALLVVGLMVLLVIALRDDEGALARILRSRPLQFLGLISYSVYMVHVPVRIVFMNLMKHFGVQPNGNDLMMNPWAGDAVMLVYLAIVLVVATFTFHLVEEPGRRFGKRLVQGRRTAVAARVS